MIVLIDNYDSFSYNLYQMIGNIDPDITVLRNDACTVPQLMAMNPDAIVLSPGPGRPIDAGICIEVVQRLSGTIPLLGVCLGHQAICEAFGGAIGYAKKLMHGKTSVIDIIDDTGLFRGVESPLHAARYHSLAAGADSLPSCLCVTACSADGEIMAIEHVEHPTWGVQFHPESIMTPQGDRIVRNFIATIRRNDND